MPFDDPIDTFGDEVVPEVGMNRYSAAWTCCTGSRGPRCDELSETRPGGGVAVARAVAGGGSVAPQPTAEFTALRRTFP